MTANVPPKSTGLTQVDAIKQTVAAADPTKPSGIALYSRFALAGAVCCSITHGALTPVDVYVFRSTSPRWRAAMARRAC
jgi:solute carrier family 25 phosphate transporter 3